MSVLELCCSIWLPLATCGYLNELKLNKSKNVVPQLHRVYFKCSVGTCTCLEAVTLGSSYIRHFYRHISSIVWGCIRPHMTVGASGGVSLMQGCLWFYYWASSHHRSAWMATRVQSWMWMRARTDLEPVGTDWNSWMTGIHKDRSACVS